MSTFYKAKLEPELYCYDRLPAPPSIRIAKVLYGPDHQADICVSLRTVDLKENPKYDALSYTWGNPRTVYYSGEEIPITSGQERQTRIICDGKILFVTRNLYDFLECLRSLVSKFGSMTTSQEHDETGKIIKKRQVEMPGELWIDAICINQADVLERNTQVAMMSQIYRLSRRLWIWLGKADPLLQSAMNFCVHLATTPVDQGKQLRYLSLERPEWNELVHAMTVDWWSIYALFHRAWFHRAWIAQEVVFSHEPAVLCEHAILSWGMLFGAAKFLFESGLDVQIADFVANELLGMKPRAEHEKAYPRKLERNNLPRLVSTKDPIAEMAVGRSVYRIHDQTYGRGERKDYDFLALLQDMRDTDATDSRDKVFATLGLAERNCHWPSQDVNISPPTPDYVKPVETVFLETACYILSVSRKLEILCYIQDRSRTRLERLPSWVPDWSTRLSPNPISGPSREHPWSASGSLEWKMPERVGPEVLHVQGAFIDRIIDAATLSALGVKDQREEFSLSNVTNIALSTPKVYPWAWGRTKIGAEHLRFDRCAFQGPAHQGSEIRPLELNIYPAAHSIEVPMAQSRVEALWRTLIADCLGGEHPAPLEAGFGFGDFVVDCIQQAGYSYGVNSLMACQDTVPGISRNTSLEYEYRAYVRSHIQLVESELNCRAVGEDPLQFFHEIERYSKENFECGFPANGIGFIPLEIQALDEHGRLKKLGEFEAKRMLKFRKQMDETSLVRRLFRTGKDFLGNGPRSLEVDDQVWVLAGAKVPFVLRPLENGRYQVVGQAYVHGIMHGEALRFNDFKMVDINLV